MPNTQSVHIDKVLSNISIGYSNENYIADKIFLPVPVKKQSDKYYVFGMEMFRQHEDARAPGTEANEITWEKSLDQYFCDGHALKTPIAIEETQNCDDGFDLEEEGTVLVTEGILLNKEIDAASSLLNASNYSPDLVFSMGAVNNPLKWSAANSDPVMDILKAKELTHKKSGIRLNTLVVSEPVLNVLKVHPKILAIFSGISSVSIASMEQIKLALGVDNILVGSALKSGALNPGQADALGYIWGNSAVLCYIPSRPGPKIQAIGYSFMWDKEGNGPVQVRKWWNQDRKATMIEAERWYSQKIVSNVAGCLFADAIVPISG